MEAWTKRASDYGPFLLFAVLTAALLPEVVFQGKVFAGFSDRVAQEIPSLTLAAQALGRGHLPLWNSYSFAGTVGLGTPAMLALYPLNLLILLLLPSRLAAATSWRLLLEVNLGMSLYFLFFHKVWKDRLLAVFSALAASLSIFTTTDISGGTYGNFFLPAVLWVLWDWKERSLRLNALLLSAALFFHISSGHFQFMAYGLLFALGLSFSREIGEGGIRAAPVRRLGALWAAALALAAALDSLQWVPFVQSQQLSNRAASLNLPMDVQPWYAALRIILPGFYGGYCPEVFLAYSGAVSLLLCAIAARRPLRRDARGWLLAAVFLALCVFHTPLRIVPQLLFLNKPFLHGRLSMLIPLCMAFLAPAGLRLFIQGSRGFQRTCVLQVAAIIGAVYLLAGGWLGARCSLASWLPADQEVSANCWIHPAADLPSRVRTAANVFLGFSAPLLLAMALHVSRRLSARGLKLSCIVLVAADLLFAARTHAVFKQFTDDSNWFPPTAVSRFLDGLPDKDQYHFDLVQFTRWVDLPVWHVYAPNAHVPYHLHALGGYDTSINGRYWDLVKKEDNPRIVAWTINSPGLADLLAAKYFVVSRQYRDLYESFSRLIFSTPDALVFEKRDPVSRFHLACRAARTADSAGKFLQDVQAPGVDLHETAFFEAADEPPGDWSRCRRDPSDEFRMEEVDPGTLRGTARLRNPSLLVVTETYVPGWRAWVNGAPVPIHRANYAFQAVELPSGDSSIELRYRFPGFAASLAAAVVSLLCLAALALWPVLVTDRLS